MKHSDMTHKLAAAFTVGALMSESGPAFATAGFQAVAGKIVTSTSTLPNLISMLAYIGGAGLAVAGIFKLKQHVDNPGQAPMKDGLIRLGAGGGLLALPAVLTAMKTTVGTATFSPTGGALTTWAL